MASDRQAVTTCDCSVCGEIRLRFNKILVVLETYGWLLDTYIVVSRESIKIIDDGNQTSGNNRDRALHGNSL